MEEFIKYAQKVAPSQTWMESELKIDKVLKWFEDYKYYMGYFISDDLLADICIQISDDCDEKKLLKLTGAKAYKVVEGISNPLWLDIKTTTAKHGVSIPDPLRTTSRRMNVVLVYKSFVVSVSAPATHAFQIAHKILMKLIVCPYEHQSANLKLLIVKHETSLLIDPITCDCCSRPSQSILKNLKICTGCMKGRYCDRDCQKKDWKTHKGACCQTPESKS